MPMTQVDDIKTAIERLWKEELSQLLGWLAEIEGQRFDERIERDAASGKLDRLIERAKASYASGLARKF